MSYFLSMYVLFNSVKDGHSHLGGCFLLFNFVGKCKNKSFSMDKVSVCISALLLILEVDSE